MRSSVSNVGLGMDRYSKTRLSALQRLEMLAKGILGREAFDRIESSTATIVAPWWRPPHHRIAPDAEAAVKEHNVLKQNMA
jgi:hypothetical protein